MAESAYKELVEAGILGAIVVICFIAIVVLFKMLIEQKDKYAALLQETLQRDDKNFETLKQALEFVKDVSKP